MAHYIDKDLLVAEIERIKKKECPIDTYEGRNKLFYFERFLSFVNTLEVAKEADLEKEIESMWAKEDRYQDTDYKIAELSKEDYANVARHFTQWQKEQMMKDAVEGWVARDECGDIAIFSDKPHRDLGLGMWIPARHAFLFPRKDEYPDVTWNSEPRKVKVIIIKE